MNKVIVNLKHEFAMNTLKKDLNDLFKGVFTWDLTIFAIFPVIITILAFFPDFTVNLRLNINSPEWWQLMTSSFVHIDFKHYTQNITLFLTLFLCQIPIVSRLNIKKHYLILFFLTVLLFPIISSAIEVAIYPIKIPNLRFSMGSSGIISAFWGIGYFLVLFALSKKKNLIDKSAYYIAICYIAISFFIIYHSHADVIKAIILLLGVIGVFLYKYRNNLKILVLSLFEENHKNKFYFILLIFLLLFFFTAPHILFPKTVADNRGAVDLFVHYMGITWGLTISYLYLSWTCKKQLSI